MNIFREPGSVLGRVSLDELTHTHKEFWDLAADIRGRLEENGYVLDQYLSLVLNAINEKSILDVADAGSNYFSDLRRCAKGVLDNDSNFDDHPLNSSIRKAAADYLPRFRESSTLRTVVCASTVMDTVQWASQDFLQNEEMLLNATVDFQEIDNLYAKICTVVGEDKMETLNDLVMRLFLPAPAHLILVQSLINEHLMVLITRDGESSLQTFQILLSSQ